MRATSSCRALTASLPPAAGGKQRWQLQNCTALDGGHVHPSSATVARKMKWNGMGNAREHINVCGESRTASAHLAGQGPGPKTQCRTAGKVQQGGFWHCHVSRVPLPVSWLALYYIVHPKTLKSTAATWPPSTRLLHGPRHREACRKSSSLAHRRPARPALQGPQPERTFGQRLGLRSAWLVQVGSQA
jgi:hypothetical protein